MEKQLKYPVGCKISWSGEEFEVIKNYRDRDHSGLVKQGDDLIDNFYFNFQGKESIVIYRN